MSKNVLVITTSLRKGENSEILADKFIRGATVSNNNVEKINLIGKSIAFCRGCLSCQKTQRCVIQDDTIALAEKILNTDVVVFATPIYYYEMSRQMKTLLDRCNPIFPSDYTFRDVYLLATAADEEPKSVNGAVKCLPLVSIGLLHNHTPHAAVNRRNCTNAKQTHR